MVNIGFRTIGFRNWRIEDSLARLSEIGYDCVELCLEHPDLQPARLTISRVRELRQLLDVQGLSVAAVSYHGAEDQLEVRRRNLYQAMEIIPRFGTDLLITSSRREKPRRLQAQVMEHIDWYEELCTAAAERGVRVAVEPQPGLVIRTTEDLVKMIQAVSHPNLVASLDVAHASIVADDISWAVFTLGPRLVNVHLADVRGKDHRHLLPGAGDVDFSEVRESLNSVGYRGPLVLDLDQPEEDPADLARRALQAFRERWLDGGLTGKA
jgi:sugar phosphate isomerase/epimerase